MANTQIPLPPLSSIQDPAVRKALQAIYDEIRLRRGETGAGGEQFVTQSELNKTKS